MPFTEAWCPCVAGKVPMDHWRKGQCTAEPLPLARIEGMLRKLEADNLHANENLTVTRLLGCPRQTIIKDSKDVYWDPRAEDSAYDGTVTHEDLKKNAPAGAYVEVRFPIEGGVIPTFLGMPIKGQVDFIKPDISGLDDYKTTRSGKGGMPFDLGRAVSVERIIQLNIYRIIIQQVTGKNPKKMRVWIGWRAPARELPDVVDFEDAAALKEAQPSWWWQDVPVRDEAWIAAQHPYGSAYTLGEHFDMYRHYWKRRAEGASVDEAVNELPMVGLMQFWGKGCSHLCPPGVRDECQRIAAGA